jgi:monovalent cation:H+ antiporter-2, CPA2 family
MSLDPSSAALSDALVVLGAAGLVIPAFARLRISPVIGFILVGLVVGPFGLGSRVDQYPWLVYITISNPAGMDVFGELGIILLLFSVGLELGFKRLAAMRREITTIGSVELLGNAALIATALWAFGYGLNAAIGLGLALALSSTALVLPISGTSGPIGKPVFAMLLFEDLALVPIIFLLGVLGTGQRDLSALGTTIGLGLVVVVSLFVVGRAILPRVFAQAARTKSPELFLSVSLLVVILASIATYGVGLSTIMGALVAGMVIAESDYGDEVRSIVSPFMNLALGIFLLTVGMRLDLTLLANQGIAITGAVVAIVTIKAVITAALLRLSGLRTAVATEIGVLMASPSELTLIVLATAVSAGLISGPDAAFWTAVTAIGLTITPLLARIGHIIALRLDATPDAFVEATPEATVVIGYGRVGEMVTAMLDRHGKTWIAVEADVDIVAAARSGGKPVQYGDAGRTGAIEALHLEAAAAVVLTMNDPVGNVRLARRLRGKYPALTIIARARDADHAAELYRAGATDAVPETLESSLQLSESLLVDLGVAMGPVIASIHEKRDELRAAIKEAGGLSEGPKLRLG